MTTMAQAPERPAVEPVDEELTPELALVDPELAERARERLARPSPARGRRPDLDRRSCGSEEMRCPTRGSRSGGVRAAAVDEAPRRADAGDATGAQSLVVALVGAIGVALLLPSLLPRGPAPPTLAPHESPAAPLNESRRRADGRGGAGREAPAVGGPRSFGWVPVKRCAPLSRRVLSRRAEDLRDVASRAAARPPAGVDVQGRRFRLSPGQYRWVVRPGFGNRRTGRYGPPVVDAEPARPPLGGFGGMGLVAGVRWASAMQGRRERPYPNVIRARLRTRQRAAQCGPTAQRLIPRRVLTGARRRRARRRRGDRRLRRVAQGCRSQLTGPAVERLVHEREAGSLLADEHERLSRPA